MQILVKLKRNLKTELLLKGHPPKIIWLRFGNNTSKFIAEILNLKSRQIKDFFEGDENKSISCLEIF